MTKTAAVVAVMLFAACTEHGETPMPDAATDSPQPLTCTEIGCTFDELDDPRCALTGAQCSCPGLGQCAWTEPLTSCQTLELTTEPANDIAEVRISGRVETPGVSYPCEAPLQPGPYTWSQHARRRDGVVGSYGRVEGSTQCEWRNATDERTPSLGACP